MTRYAYDTATNVQIKAIWCSTCGIAYGLPDGYAKARREDGKTWRCPNGCAQVYRKTDADTLREQLDAARSLASREADRRRLAESQRAAARGHVTRLRKRIGNGVCPCCNRSFSDLAQHIAGQHPDFRLDDADLDTGIRVDDLSPSQVTALQRIGDWLDRGGEGIPADYLHAGTVRALERRLVITVEGREDDDLGLMEFALPTAMGLRLIGEAGKAR